LDDREVRLLKWLTIEDVYDGRHGIQLILLLCVKLDFHGD
jgi:hypothetical protein